MAVTGTCPRCGYQAAGEVEDWAQAEVHRCGPKPPLDPLFPDHATVKQAVAHRVDHNDLRAGLTTMWEHVEAYHPEESWALAIKDLLAIAHQFETGGQG